MARKSTRSRALKKYWRKVHGIARDEGLSVEKARKIYRMPKKYWRVVMRTTYHGKNDDTNIQSMGYIEAETAEDAISEQYDRIADHFGRERDEFIPRSRFRVEAFRTGKLERGFIKWKHKKGSWLEQQL